jgi:hypothetical protein
MASFLVKSDPEKAEGPLRKALVARQEILGFDIPLTLDSVFTLGLFLGVHNKLEELERFLRQAYAGWMKIFGADHEDTVQSTEALASVLLQQNKFGEVLDLMASVRQCRQT